MRCSRITDIATPDIGDRLPGGHRLADGDQSRICVTVIDISPRERTCRKVNDWSYWTESLDPFANDYAWPDCNLDGG